MKCIVLWTRLKEMVNGGVGNKYAWNIEESGEGCKQSFARKTKLQMMMHMNRYVGATPFQCKTCWRRQVSM